MLMQALRNGFFRVKKKRDLAGRGLPPVACSFLSFSLCFLFSSSSFMMNDLAPSALAAMLMLSLHSILQFQKKKAWPLDVKSQTRLQNIAPLPWRPVGLQISAGFPAALFSSLPSSWSPPLRATDLSPQLRASDRGKITPAEKNNRVAGRDEQLAPQQFNFRLRPIGRPCLGLV